MDALREIQAKNMRLVEENSALRVEVERLQQAVEASRVMMASQGMAFQQPQQPAEDQQQVQTIEEPAIQVVMLQPEFVDGPEGPEPGKKKKPVQAPPAPHVCVMQQ